LYWNYYLDIMNKKPAADLDSNLFPSPVLITESKTDFDELHAALRQELAPRGVVEKLFVADIANLVWELRRLRRSKTAIWNMESKHSVHGILCRSEGGFAAADRRGEEKASEVWLWLSNAGREDIFDRLEASGHDEWAGEAETMRRLALEVEMYDRMMASLEMRIRNAFRAIADYRETFANPVRMASNRLLEATPVIELEKRRTKKAD
jgi:hypothetical protein